MPGNIEIVCRTKHKFLKNGKLRIITIIGRHKSHMDIQLSCGHGIYRAQINAKDIMGTVSYERRTVWQVN